nr:MAG TPA: hypothetical protein [Caudoviricetes sp.]
MCNSYELHELLVLFVRILYNEDKRRVRYGKH